MPGIKETLEVLDFGLQLANGIVKSLPDINVDDLGNVIPSLLVLPAALENISQVPVELSDLDSAELAQIREKVLASIPNVGERWLTVATESVNIAIGVYRIFQALKKP